MDARTVLESRTPTLKGLRGALLRRAAVDNPAWTDVNESDPGVTLLEVFVFLGESLLSRVSQLSAAARWKISTQLCTPSKTALRRR